MSRAVVVLAALIVPAVALAQRADQTANAPADHARLPPPPLAPLAIPAEWEPQPALADAALAATAADRGPRAMSAEAWGRPLLGCYVVQLAINLDASFVPSTLLAQLHTILEGAGTVEEWTDDPWLASARLRRPGWRVDVRAEISAGNRPDLELLACVAGDRAPERCQAACAPILSALTAPTPTPKPRTP